MAGRCSLRQTRGTHLLEKIMDEEITMEWGPAHFRDEAQVTVFEPVERPDDN